MPSLEQLENFKASFGNIAGETAALTQQGLPLDDLPLPGAEPVAPPPPTEEPPPQKPDAQTPADRNNAPEPLFPAEPDDTGPDLNFADLLGGGSENLSPPPAAEAVIEQALANMPRETSGNEEPAPEDIPDLNFDEAFDGPGEAETGDTVPAVGDDFDLDDELDLSGFRDDAAIAGDDLGAETNAAADADGLDDGLDFQDFPDFGDDAAFPEMTQESPAEEAYPDTMEGLLDGFADDIESGYAADAEEDEAHPSEEESGETDLGDAFPGEADMTLGEGGESLAPEMGIDLSPGSGQEPEAQDPFEGFSPDGGDVGFSGGEESGSQDAPNAEFALPDIVDLFGGNASPIPGMGASSVGRVAGSMAPEDTVEEIRLDEEELYQLRNTLANYPLNLRIAIEEIIAEQAVAPNLMSSLIKLLVRNGSPREAASLAAKILGRPVPIPRGFEKKTGKELEAEQASFPYIFAHRFLPVLRFALVIATLAVSVFYLSYRFIYTPAHANSIYKQGYELIPTGSYAQANERFNRAFQLHRQKDWFYRYAEAFRDERQYIYAEEKYDQLLNHFPRDKKGALDYAAMETNYLRNYVKADSIIRHNILEYAIDDREGLLALGDNNLIWGEIDSSRYEEARGSYARLLEIYGWQDPIVERMMKYFIRVDNLGEVLPLQQYFMADPKRRRIAASTLAELGGYLLDKRFEEARGVPDEHIDHIEGIRDVLLRAALTAPRLPEAHYHLARYYARFGNKLEERQTLEIAARLFDIAPEESARRTRCHLDTLRRLGEMLINNREFFSAEEQLVKGIGLYEDALDRRFLTRSPEFGRLYADLGDLEYFTKPESMPQALDYYLRSELNGWAPPEIQYRIGAAYYQQQQWAPALDRFFAVSSAVPANRRLLNALGNVSYMRGDYFNAQGYYNRLVDMLDAERARFPMLMPNDRPEHLELAERMMVVRNNLAVSLEALTKATGNRGYRSRALGLYAESERAWDYLTRNPATMVRAGAGDLSSPGMNLAFLNSRNTLYPEPDYEPQLYIQIDRDLLEPSDWEALVPRDFRLTDVVEPYRQR
jgi:hypothetical protein